MKRCQSTKKNKIYQNEIKLKNRLIYQDSSFIFEREDGHPQLRKVIETRLKRLLKKAGIKRMSPPTLLGIPIPPY
ncbi:hypothetical protein [Bacillus subtilis]|uniref:hypothetical protein n=1 Tax=Bacillus subtilis TaxID=1423 RepID=UPI0020278B96|nr:hypothetical protein [Bacillus subtilis]